MFKKLWRYFQKKTPSKTSKSLSANSFSPEEKELIETLERFVDKERFQQGQASEFQETEIVVETLQEETALTAPLSESLLIDTPTNSLTERYEKIKTLGSGGMGIVHLVYDHLLGREVALKQVRLYDSLQEGLSRKQELMLWRLNQEARITATLDHPNIVPLYDVQQKTRGEFLFTMRKIEGKTLRELLLEKKHSSQTKEENELLLIFYKICDAVAYAHAKNVVHRDLKPENIMVGEFGEVYVMDWGIAKKLDDTEETILLENIRVRENNNAYQTVGGLGTPGYMPPEQRENASLVMQQADIYSLGKILKECFTLLSPKEELKKQIEEDTKKRSLSDTEKKAILTDEEPSPLPECPEEIKKIVEKATEPNWKNRYETVHQFVTHLQAYQKKQKGIQEALQKAEEALHKANTFTFQAKQEKSQKLQYLLTALNMLDSALLLKREPHLEERKLHVGQLLIQLSCQNQDYDLAHSIIQELEDLTLLSIDAKKQLYEHVESERTKLLRLHLKQFQEWEERLRWQKQEERIREDAIFEISKMVEEEIFQKLLHILEEGTQIYLQNTFQGTRENDFYETMIFSLGRMENVKAAPYLLKALTQMAQKWSAIHPEEQPKEAIQYMVTLAYALGYTKAPKTSYAFDQIRKQMGYGTFRTRTRYPYQKLAQLEGLEEISSDDAIGYLERGIIKYNQHNLSGAIEEYTKAIELYPENAEAYTRRGIAKKTKRDLQGAIQDYSKAIEINPQESQNYSNRAEAFYYQKAFEKALQDCNQAIALNDQEMYAYYHRGNIKKASGDIEGAIEDYSKALELNPQFAAAYNRRGLARMAQKKTEEAISDYTKVLLLNPQDDYAYFNRGEAKQAKGDWNGALEDLNIFLKNAPGNHPQFVKATQLFQEITQKIK